MEDIVTRLREYGSVYKNIKSDMVKQQLLLAAPQEVLEGFALAAKNILLGHINLTPTEHKRLMKCKKSLKDLGLRKHTPKKRRELLSCGGLLQTLSKIMSKLKANKKNVQQGGMLPGLILSAVKAKKRKQNVGKAMGDYLKGAVGRRVAVAKTVAGRKVPTPKNTGMDAKKFLMSGLFGLG